MLIPPEVYGPAGAVVVLAIVAYVLARVIQGLWIEHLRADQDDRDQRDRALALLDGILPTLRDISSAIASANRDAATRHRRDDPPNGGQR